MSRAEALGMLDRLCSTTGTSSTGTRTDEISLIDQVESELEARFLDTLLAAARHARHRPAHRPATDHDGARIADLRFTRDAGRTSRTGG